MGSIYLRRMIAEAITERNPCSEFSSADVLRWIDARKGKKIYSLKQIGALLPSCELCEFAGWYNKTRLYRLKEAKVNGRDRRKKSATLHHV